MSKRLLILAAGILQVPVIKRAKEMGCYVIAADGDPNAVGFTYADKAICANIVSEDEMLKIAMDERVDGVIHPCSEVSMTVMGRINEVMGLSGITRGQAINATNKHMMRQAFESYGAPSPLSILTESVDNAWNVFDKTFSGNAILKPSRNSGSRGIAKIHKGMTKEDFVYLYSIALNESRDRSVLIEQFVEGPEFSVEIIVWDNKVNVLAVTDKKTTGAPHFVELGHNQPSRFPNDVVAKVCDAAVAGVKALGVNSCACHAEVKVQEGKAYLMEVGARMGGDFISTVLTRLSSGVDMIAAAVNCSLGLEPNLQPNDIGVGVCIRYFTPKPGVLVDIKNVDVLKHPSVYDSAIYCNVGNVVHDVTSSLSRCGHIIVTAENADAAVELAEELISSVEFDTK